MISVLAATRKLDHLTSLFSNRIPDQLTHHELELFCRSSSPRAKMTQCRLRWSAIPGTRLTSARFAFGWMDTTTWSRNCLTSGTGRTPRSSWCAPTTATSIYSAANHLRQLAVGNWSLSVNLSDAGHHPRLVLCQSILHRPPDMGAHTSFLGSVPRAWW